MIYLNKLQSYAVTKNNLSLSIGDKFVTFENDTGYFYSVEDINYLTQELIYKPHAGYISGIEYKISFETLSTVTLYKIP